MDRFEAFALLFDPSTFRHLDGLGLDAGWRCLGGGGRRDLGGRSLARPGSGPRATSWPPTSMSTWAGALRRPQRRGPRARCGADPAPPGGPFDLVHARLVLVHVPERERALPTWSAALRPGRHPAGRGRRPGPPAPELPGGDGPAQVLANRMRTRFPGPHGGAGGRPGLRAHPAPAPRGPPGWSTWGPMPPSRWPTRPATPWRRPPST